MRRDTANKIGGQLIRRVEAVSRGFHSQDVAVAAVATTLSAFAGEKIPHNAGGAFNLAAGAAGGGDMRTGQV